MPWPRSAHAERSDSSRARAVARGGVVAALLGLLVGVRPLFACGCGLLCVALLAVIWVNAGVRGVTVRRELVDRQVVEGELMEATITVTGRSALLFGVRVSDPFTGRCLAVRAHGWMPTPGGHREQRVMIAAGRRGRHGFAAPRIVLDDPLGLATACGRAASADDEVLVLPRTEVVDWGARGWHVVGGDHPAGRTISAAGEVDGLRTYQPGTPATRIHWPSLARGSGLLERRLVAALETRPTVVLDARAEQSQDGQERLDAAVRAAASLILGLARRGGCAVLLPGAKLPVVIGHNLQGWGSLHTQLALVEAQWHRGQGPTIRPENVRGPLIYVSTGTVRLPPAALTSRYQVIHVLPRAGGHPSERPLFEVAGCGGYPLGRTASGGVAA